MARRGNNSGSTVLIIALVVIGGIFKALMEVWPLLLILLIAGAGAYIWHHNASKKSAKPSPAPPKKAPAVQKPSAASSRHPVSGAAPARAPAATPQSYSQTIPPAPSMPAKVDRVSSASVEPKQSMPSFQTKSAEEKSYAIPPAPKGMSIPGGAKWLAPGESIQIGTYTLEGGMLYVGSGLRGKDGNVEPALIDPSLAVDSTASYRQDLMDYWPSY